MFHTKLGMNYRSKAICDYLQSKHIKQSFSRAYVPYDNSVEEFYRTKYRSESEFKAALAEYIIFYNTKRPHKKLQYRTPDQWEEEYTKKQGALAAT